MNFTCYRCLQDISFATYSTDIPYEDLAEFGIDVRIRSHVCRNCQITIALQTDHSPQWRSIEECLTVAVFHNENGWWSVRDQEDALILYLLTRIYNETSQETDPLFGMPDELSHAKIYWMNRKAIAFYVFKPKVLSITSPTGHLLSPIEAHHQQLTNLLQGTLVYATRENYPTHTLDTAFVLPDYRRKGLGYSMLQDMAASRPGEDLAISTPISKPMAHVIYKFLEDRPDYRMKMWEIEGAGSCGNRKLLHFTLQKRLIASI